MELLQLIPCFPVPGECEARHKSKAAIQEGLTFCGIMQLSWGGRKGRERLCGWGRRARGQVASLHLLPSQESCVTPWKARPSWMATSLMCLAACSPGTGKQLKPLHSELRELQWEWLPARERLWEQPHQASSWM